MESVACAAQPEAAERSFSGSNRMERRPFAFLAEARCLQLVDSSCVGYIDATSRARFAPIRTVWCGAREIAA
jgi:hypothetical protein